VAITQSKRACSVCGTAVPYDSPYCPVCALQGALESKIDSASDTFSELRFEHYQVLSDEDGNPWELGRGGMGVTYKAIDTRLRCPVALKVISTQFIDSEAARRRFTREARAAASLRHPNAATVFHLGESRGNYFYAMEFVDGETLESLIRRGGQPEIELALEIVTQVAAGLSAIHKQHLVHRDIKPANIMLSWEEGRLENVKIIDLGLAKGVTEDTLSIAGSFVGTPAYASPEQFAGFGTDIRSDLYSLGVTLWEMLSGKPPFNGSVVELMDQHQHAGLPLLKLRNVPEPILALVQVLLAKDPNQRFQTPAQLQHALTKVRGAIASGLPVTADELRTAGNQRPNHPSKAKSRKQPIRWMLGAGMGFMGLLLAWFFFSGHSQFLFNRPLGEAGQNSIAVLPFENISANKDDGYFADGVQDEILNNLAKVAQLKVISRTSVMQYRAGTERDLRQIASSLDVANVLEGTVRRDGNRVRISTELVDARSDNTIWADSYDRDLIDIFAIQSEIAQTIVQKLAASLSPVERRLIEQKPTENLAAYDLYLKAKLLIARCEISLQTFSFEKKLRDAIDLLDQAVKIDPKFALAYCAMARAHDLMYIGFDPTSSRRGLADASIETALQLGPELPEVQLGYAYHVYFCYQDYDRARAHVRIAKAGLPNSADTFLLPGFIDRRQGQFEQAVQELRAALELDPHNPGTFLDLGITLAGLRRFREAAEVYDRAVIFAPDQPAFKMQKEQWVTFNQTGDATSLRKAIAELPPPLAADRGVLSVQIAAALYDRDWMQANSLLQHCADKDNGFFGYAGLPVPIGCYSILLARLQAKEPSSHFQEIRDQLDQQVKLSATDPNLLSTLAVVDVLLGRNEAAIKEAKSAVEMLPISKDTLDGPGVLANSAVVNAWTGQIDEAFGKLETLARTPFGIYYGQLKKDPLWDPLRQDPRFEKLLAELAPRD
jgi:serine/threonine protein kinase/Tfp pilus assembly protein PilF